MVGSSLTPMASIRVASISDIRPNDIGADIGVRTIDNLRNVLTGAGLFFGMGL